MPARVAVVVNPAAGRGRALHLIPTVRGLLKSLGVEYSIEVSSAPDQPEKLARRAAEDGVGIVAALGGDGLAGMVSNGLMSSKAGLAVIPAGTGNDLARSLGLDRKDPLSAVRMLADPKTRPMDVLQVTSGRSRRYCLNVAGAGFDSEVNETANATRTRLKGSAKYVAALLRTLRRFEPADFELVVDGKEIRRRAMLIAIGNGRSYGGGMRVCPDASLFDGSVDVCIVGEMSKGEFLGAFPKVFRGTHVKHGKVTMLRGKEIELRADRRLMVYGDGEPAGPLPASFLVLPAALPVVVP
ncbi:MAG: diacylglycerol kinase family protein [Actinomycetota bacterium]